MLGFDSSTSKLTRRSFLKAAGATSLGAAAAGSLGFGGGALAALAQEEAVPENEEIVSTICSANCFQACMLNAHVRDGKVVKMSRGDYPEEIYSGCCLRGLSIPERTYSDNRLKYPLKRVEGTERGAGEWERISWDQAIDEITTQLKAIGKSTARELSRLVSLRAIIEAKRRQPFGLLSRSVGASFN